MNIISIITDAKLFNYLIALLYGISCIRFLYDGRYLESFYFLLVMALTLTINLMIKT